MPKFLRKLIFEKESFNGDELFYWLSFKDKLYVTLLIFLVIFLLQGIVVFSYYHQLHDDLKTKSLIERQLDEVWQLKRNSANIPALSVVSVRNGNTLEVEDILIKLNNHMAKLKSTGEPNDFFDDLSDNYDALVQKLKYYAIFNMDKAQYQDFRKVYQRFLSAENNYEQFLIQQVQRLKKDLKALSIPFTISMVLFLAGIIAAGWLILSAVLSVFIPVKLIVKHFRQDTIGPAIPIYSQEGLGKAGISLNEGLAKWKMIGIDIRGMIGKFEHFCRQIIAEVRLREITEVQLHEIYTAIEAYFNDQNTTIKKSNEQLKFLADNFANLQKIPSRLKQIAEQIANLATSTKTQLQEIFESSFEFRDESGKITKLFTNLTDTLEQVNHVMKVLYEVAEQTELLSFNTAIEAAKAGEKGLGFGVISREISKIVVRSRKTSDNLKQLIIQIKDKTMEIVKALPDAVLSKEIAEDIINSSSAVCVGIYETTDACVNNIIKLMGVLEVIYVKSSEIAPEADLISGITASEEEDLRNIELKILDYQLNVRQEIREAEKLNEAIKELRPFLAN